MARFGFNDRRYEMIMSALLVYATRRTANCVALAILIGSYQLVNDIRAHGGNASHSSVTQQSSRTQLHFRHRVRVQLQETVSAGTGSRGGGVSCLSSLC